MCACVHTAHEYTNIAGRPDAHRGLVLFRDSVSPGCPGTHSVDQVALELRDPPASASQVPGLKMYNHRHCQPSTIAATSLQKALLKAVTCPRKMTHLELQVC